MLLRINESKKFKQKRLAKKRESGKQEMIGNELKKIKSKYIIYNHIINILVKKTL